MPKKITITLTAKAEKFFKEIMYSLDFGNGKPATQSQAINWSLEALEDFECEIGEDLISWLKYYKENNTTAPHTPID